MRLFDALCKEGKGMKKSDICLWVCVVCAALLLFSLAITVVGYRSFTLGRIATMAVVALGAAMPLVARARLKRAE